MNRRSNPLILVLLALAAGTVMWAIEGWLTSSGSPSFTPSLAFSATLLALAIAAIIIGWPVRRYTQATRKAAEANEPDDREALQRKAAALRVAPERATLSLALAKASALAGAIFVGGCAGVVAWLMSRSVPGDGLVEGVTALVAAGLLTGAGLLVESWCILPPDGNSGEESSSLTSSPSAG